MYQDFNPSRDQQALAAYYLGYRSRTLWLWHELFWTCYFVDERTVDDSGLEHGPILAAEEIDRARIVCGKTIEPHNYVDILDIHRSFVLLPKQAIESWREMDSGERKIRLESEPPYRDKWERLQDLVETAFDPRNVLSHYCHLGLAIGDYELALRKTPDLPKFLDRNTSMPALLEAARVLPADVLRDMPLLSKIVELEPVWSGEGPRAFFASIFNELDATRGERPRGLERFPLQGRLIADLHEEISKVLASTPMEDCEGLGREEACPSTSLSTEGSPTDPEQFAFYLRLKRCIVVFTLNGKTERDEFRYRVPNNGYAIINFLMRKRDTEFGPAEIEEALKGGLASSTLQKNERIASEFGGRSQRTWKVLRAQGELEITKVIDYLRRLQERARRDLESPAKNSTIDYERDCRMILQLIREDLMDSKKISLIDELINSDMLSADFSRLGTIKEIDFRDLNGEGTPDDEARDRVGKAITDAIRNIQKTMPETAKYLKSTIRNPFGTKGISYVPVAGFSPEWVLHPPTQG
jgi:hypothetical protein